MKQTISILTIILFSCNVYVFGQYESTGSIEKFHRDLDKIITSNSKIEIIAEGFDWSEGPLWIESENKLLFSDIPKNTVYQWSENKGIEVYLFPSGYTKNIPREGETGSNGLLLDKDGSLVLCQHGDRQIAKMRSPITSPRPTFTPLAKYFKGKKLNSPNDATYNSKNELYFTDPPYGLEKRMDDPAKELDFQGVYKMDTYGNVTLMTDSITRPNGIAFFPEEKQLIVANSDPNKPDWYLYDVNDNGLLQNGRIFKSAKGYNKKQKGLPDGLKIDSQGNVFATGPGGVWIFNKSGRVLGKIRLADASSNCALSPDEKTLYITNHMKLLRVKMR